VLGKIKSRVFSGKRLSGSDALKLFESDDLFTIGELAAHSAQRKNGRKAYYVRNLHVNPTNICVNRCRFCAFSRSKGDNGAYELTIKEIVEKISSVRPYEIDEVHIVGGLHPDRPFDHYLRMLNEIKRQNSDIHVKAFTAVEIDYMQRISGLELDEVLDSLRDNGLDSIPGGGAEIFAVDVRKSLCPEKIPADRWLEVMEAAHARGIRSNATMLYGHIENYGHRVEHLLKLRELQDRTNGFQAFIPLSYHPLNTEEGGCGPSGIDDLKTVAVSRLVLDNFPHIKAYWVMLGEKVSQLALHFGADDLDGTVIDENITYSAGAVSRRGIKEAELAHLIKKAGKRPVRRDSFYRAVRN
jgi:aminodeoxyfutalosine synthase